jgi:uncharacterized membrane protein YgcG
MKTKIIDRIFVFLPSEFHADTSHNMAHIGRSPIGNVRHRFTISKRQWWSVLIAVVLAVAFSPLKATAVTSNSSESRPYSRDLAPLTTKVIDLAAVLDPQYRADLDSRLARLAEKSGYAIHIVLTPGSYHDLINMTENQYDLNKLASFGSAGTALIMIAPEESRVLIRTSNDLLRTVSPSHLEKQIESILGRHGKKPERAIEYSVNAVLLAIDPWFYVLPSPAPNIPTSLVRFPIAEMVLLPLAPFIGLMTGIILMAFTSAGKLHWPARFLVSGLVSGLVLVSLVPFIRQPGGIIPGMLYYGAITSSLLAGFVGALKTYWFSDTFKGKASDAWWAGPVHFRQG